MLQQSLPFTVCAEGCETAEAQSDDEVRTSQVPEQSEGKTKVIKKCTYRLRYLNPLEAILMPPMPRFVCYNSTYRLRY